MAIYLVTDGEHVKIGTSRNPKGRIVRLQTANSRALRTLAILPGDVVLEQELHARYAAKRVRGEWFQLTPDDVSAIEEYANRGVGGKPVVDVSGWQPGVVCLFSDVVSYALVDVPEKHMSFQTQDEFWQLLRWACLAGQVTRVLVYVVLQHLVLYEARTVYLHEPLEQMRQLLNLDMLCSGESCKGIVEYVLGMAEDTVTMSWYSDKVVAQLANQLRDVLLMCGALRIVEVDA